MGMEQPHVAAESCHHLLRESERQVRLEDHLSLDPLAATPPNLELRRHTHGRVALTST